MENHVQHDAIAPIAWLIGKWDSISAEGSYPTIKPFTYCEQVEFQSIGQPMLNYSSKSWNAENKKPMHQERGFLLIKPSSFDVSFQVAHNFGLTTIEEGVVANNEINLKSCNIARTRFSKDPAVTMLERRITLIDNETLEITTSMSTTKTELTQHLKVLYKKQCRH